MTIAAGGVELGAFACEFGDRERTPDSIEDFAALCTSQGLVLGLSALGCDRFCQMTRPIESYVTKCVSETLSASGVPSESVRHIVFSTSDRTLRLLDQDFVRNVLESVGLVRCIPTLVSMQQCVSSLAALDYAHRLFADPSVDHAIVVAFDFVVDERDRIRSFALFGDAVTSCMVSRSDVPKLSFLSYAVDVDFSGIVGRDDFESRRRVAVATLQRVLLKGDTRIDQIQKCFTTNFFKPIALINGGICGIQRSQLGIDTLSSRAHCGSCDWMMNLSHHREHVGLTPGGKYLVQSYAPGFFACGLLQS